MVKAAILLYRGGLVQAAGLAISTASAAGGQDACSSGSEGESLINWGAWLPDTLWFGGV